MKTTDREMSMQKLLYVQKVDLRIRDMETEAAAIPEKFKEWNESVSEKESRLLALEAEIEESKKSLRQLERQLDQKQEDFSKFNSQLPLIKTNREYKAILLEIDAVEKDISDIEELMLERMTEVDDKESTATEEKAKVDAAKQEAEREKAGLELKQRELEELLRGTRSEREHLAADVDAPLLNQYDRIRIRKGGQATAQIYDESCGACHMLLPPQVVNEVIGGAVKICPSCNRILYWLDS